MSTTPHVSWLSSLRPQVTQRLWGVVGRLLSPGLANVLRLMAGASPAALVRRGTRLWSMSRSMLKGDLHSPLPVRLQVETTDICNLKCVMCAREVLDGMDSTTMGADQFRALVDEVDPVYVTLNGLGEPLIDKTIFEKLAHLRARSIFSSMPTNGSFVYGKRLTGLVDHMPDSLTISIDGATKASFETIRKLGDFERIVSNVKSLIERRQREGKPRGDLKVLFALQKDNLFDFKEAFELVESLKGIDQFNLVPVFDYNPEGDCFRRLIPTAEDVKALDRAIEDHLTTVTNPGERRFHESWRRTAHSWHQPASEPPSQPRNGTRHSCLVPWFSSYVDAKGRVYPCCYLLTTSHVMGNINDQSFEEVWQGERYQAFRRDLIDDRSQLNGCAACPRNDDDTLAVLRKYELLLFTRGRTPSKQREGARTVRLPVVH
jgi:radical SAM protein with 4Fe4S-binding SPASM domain